MKKIITILGARPQFVKAAVVSRAIASYPDEIQEIIVHTGQHYDLNMSDIFFDEMDIPKPVYNLGIGGSSHGASTGLMLSEIEKVLFKEQPSAVIVYGDTNSTLAGALAAKKIHIPVVHIEAGLRSFNMNMPEEVNRIITDRISDILFCPTETSIKNLNAEGFELFNNRIILSGDVMYDTAKYYEKKSDSVSKIINTLGLEKSDFILATIHRAENTNDITKLKSILEALDVINANHKIILPLHPRTRKVLKDNNLKTHCTVIDPVGYFDMIQLIKHSKLILTDSGGLQKEAYFFKKGCITLREETEWTELIENGYNFLAGSNKELILKYYETILNSDMSFSELLYGDGTAADLIAKVISDI